jgi:hypothetical protein
MEQPGLVERVDHLTGAVADLAFKLDMLISSTTAFRESFGDRMTDYADLVAHWSIETEQNLANHRRAADRVTDDVRRAVADQGSTVARLAATLDGLAEALGKTEQRLADAMEAVAGEVREAGRVQSHALRALVEEGDDGDDGLDSVRAELAALRELVADGLGALRAAVGQGAVATAVREALADRPEPVRAELDEEGVAVAVRAALAGDLGALRAAVAEGGDASSLREELAALRELLDRRDPQAERDALAQEVASLWQAVERVGERSPEGEAPAAAVAALEETVAADLASLRRAVDGVREELVEQPSQADALAAVLAEVAGLRKDVPEAMAALGPGGDLATLADEVRGLRRDLARLPDGEAELGRVAAELRELRELLAEEEVEAVEDDASFAAALGEQLAELRADVSRLAGADAPDLVTVVEDLAALRGEVAAIADQVATRPPVPPEVLALTAELQALRTELEQEQDAAVPPAVDAGAPPADERLHETLAELVFEVRALRRRFPVRATDAPPAADPDADGGSEPPKRRRRTT